MARRRLVENGARGSTSSASAFAARDQMKKRRRRTTVVVPMILALVSAASNLHTQTIPLAYGFSTSSFPGSLVRRKQGTFTSALSSARVDSMEPSSRTWNVQRHPQVQQRLSGGAIDDRSRSRKKMKPMPITGYNYREIAEYYDRRPLQVGWRLNSLGIPMLGWYFTLLIDKAVGISEKEGVQRKRGEDLRRILVQSKSVALIKSGQALSLRPDLIKNKIWAEELGRLVDAVGSFQDDRAMRIIKSELKDLLPRMKVTKKSWEDSFNKRRAGARTKLEKISANDPILSLFEFYNDNYAVASASIGQVYKAKIRRGAQLEAAIGKEEAQKWGGRTVAIKVQRPDVEASASLDMYLLRRTAEWLSKMRGGGLPDIADQFGIQLFGELDYIREANNCERFRELYGNWQNVMVPDVCTALTRKRVSKADPWDQSAHMTVSVAAKSDKFSSAIIFTSAS